MPSYSVATRDKPKVEDFIELGKDNGVTSRAAIEYVDLYDKYDNRTTWDASVQTIVSAFGQTSTAKHCCDC